MLVRLVTGCSWVDAERLTGSVVSDTTLRARRDEWIDAGVFDELAEAMLASYHLEIGLELGDVAVDGSLQKAPCGGEGTGKSPVDRGKLGWKWSIATDSVASDRLDRRSSEPQRLRAFARDPGARSRSVGCSKRSERCISTVAMTTATFVAMSPHSASPTSSARASAARARSLSKHRVKSVLNLGMRWPVERTNSWLSNYGQLRRNTDRHTAGQARQLAFVIAILLIAKLIDQRENAGT